MRGARCRPALNTADGTVIIIAARPQKPAFHRRMSLPEDQASSGCHSQPLHISAVRKPGKAGAVSQSSTRSCVDAAELACCRWVIIVPSTPVPYPKRSAMKTMRKIFRGFIGGMSFTRRRAGGVHTDILHLVSPLFGESRG